MKIQRFSMRPSENGNSSTRENQITKRHFKKDKEIVYMTQFDPTTSSSRSCEIGYTIKDSMLTGNIRKEVGCITYERIRGEQSYKCLYCDLKYKSKGRKDTHEREFHTNRQIYSCASCGKGFETKENLNNHQRVHSPYRPFPCSFCSYRFITNLSLERHCKIHLNGAQLQESIQPLEIAQPVEDKNIPSLSVEGPSTKASGQITSHQMLSLTKVDNGSLGTHPVGNNDLMTSSNESNEDSAQMAFSDNPVSSRMEVEDDETVEFENETNFNPVVSSSDENIEKEWVQDEKMKERKGMRKSKRNRKAKNKFSASPLIGKRRYYKCPHCKKRFGSSSKRDRHVTQNHNQTPSVPDCKPVEDTNGPFSSKKVLFQAGISNLNPSTAQAFSDKRDNLTNSPTTKSGTRTKSQTWRKSVSGRKDLPIEVPQNFSSTGKNKCEKCEKTFGTMHSLKRHKQDFHSEVYRFECSLCDLKFPRKDYYEYHLKTKQHLELEATKEILPTRDQAEPQPQNGSSISAEGLTEDIAMSSSAAGNNNVTFKSTAKRVGDIDYPLACGECNAGFVNDVELVFHVQNSHPDKGFDCQLCSNRGLSLLDYYTCLHSHFAS